MSYNNYNSYGYSPYFDQASQPPSRSSEQTSNAQQYGYQPNDTQSPYYQGGSQLYEQLPHKPGEHQTAKADDANPSSIYPPRSTISDVRSPVYPQYQHYDNVQREGNGDGEGIYRVDGHYSNTTPAPAPSQNLAYSSNTSRDVSTTPSYHQPPTSKRPVSRGAPAVTSPEYSTLPRPTTSATRGEAKAQYQPQTQAQGRQLSNPSQYQVNYSPHTRPNPPLYRFPSPQQPLPPASSVAPTLAQSKSSASTLARLNSTRPRSSQSNAEAPRQHQQANHAHSHQDQPQTQTQYSDSTSYSNPNTASYSGTNADTNANHQPHEPTTVDPSQVFDQAEYQRKAAEVDSARRKENSQLEHLATSLLNQKPGADAPPSTADAKHARTDSSSREQIQAEMRTMIERMRDFKAKDPAGFSEIWEQFKKVQPPRAASQTPQAAKASATAHESILSPAQVSAGFPSPQVAPETQSPPQTQPSHENLPDLGKFPFQRRRRKNRKSGPAEQMEIDTSKHLPNIDPALLQEPMQTQSPTMAMQDAMRQYHSTPRAPDPLLQVSSQSVLQNVTQNVTQNVLYVPQNANMNGRKTLWPKHKSSLLADVAKQALEAEPENRGKSISAAQIMAMLTTDPTYDQWCMMLLDEGFTVHRSKLAKIILSVLNDSPGQASDPATAPGSISTLFAQNESANTFTSPNPREPPNSNPSIKSPTEPKIIVSPKTDAPLTKGQMARKRDFAEIIDLSQAADSESEEEAQPMKKPFPGPDRGTDLRSLSSTLPSVKTHTPKMAEVKAPTVTNSYVEKLRTEVVALPIQHKHARRTSHYNPATLARDLLIAKGEHPTQRPLNFHLMGLVSTFKHVNWNTDLKTFRWDLVDPGEPPVDITKENTSNIAGKLLEDRQGVEEKNAPLLQSILSRGRGRGRRAGGRGRPRGRPRVHGSPGRGQGDWETLSTSNTEPMLREPNPTTPRGAKLVSRGGRARGALSRGGRVHSPTVPSFTPVNQPLQRTMLEQTASQDDSEAEGIQTGQVIRVDSSAAQTPSSGQKRRGRPPKHVDPIAGRVASTTPSLTPSSTPGVGPKKLGRPPGSKNLPKGTAFASRGRGRGRGRGGRPSAPRVNTQIPADGVGIIVPSRSPSAATPLIVSHIEQRPPVQERRPPRWKARPTYPSEVPDTDAYPTFKCRWQGCPGNLHNLETLVKHVKKIHGHRDMNSGKYACRWHACTQKLGFDDLAAWETHIEEAHLDVLAQAMGDGPSTHPSEVPPSRYLSDPAGHQITPLARTSGTPDPLPLNAGRSPTRAYHKAHGNVTPDEKAEAEAASLRTHRLRAQERIQEKYERSMERGSFDGYFSVHSTTPDAAQHEHRSGAFVVI